MTNLSTATSPSTASARPQSAKTQATPLKSGQSEKTDAPATQGSVMAGDKVVLSGKGVVAAKPTAKAAEAPPAGLNKVMDGLNKGMMVGGGATAALALGGVLMGNTAIGGAVLTGASVALIGTCALMVGSVATLGGAVVWGVAHAKK